MPVRLSYSRKQASKARLANLHIYFYPNFGLGQRKTQTSAWLQNSPKNQPVEPAWVPLFCALFLLEAKPTSKQRFVSPLLLELANWLAGLLVSRLAG